MVYLRSHARITQGLPSCLFKNERAVGQTVMSDYGEIHVRVLVTVSPNLLYGVIVRVGERSKVVNLVCVSTSGFESRISPSLVSANKIEKGLHYDAY